MNEAAFISRFIFMLLLAFSFDNIEAQEMLIKHFTVKDGLPSATVYSIIQDKQGFMWMATEAGVSRFDGKKFTNYSLTDGLGENEILKVFQDSRGRIWFLGFNGTLSYYLNDRFYNSSTDTLLKKVPRNNSYIYFFEDKRHRLWFATGFGYVVIDGRNVNYYTYYSTLNREISDKNLDVPNEVRYLYTYLPDSSILFFSPRGMPHQRDTIKSIVTGVDKRLADIEINIALITPENKLWVVGKGVYCYDYRDHSKPVRQYLKGIRAAGITTDDEGNIWIGTTNNGVYRLESWRGITGTYNSVNGLESDNIFSVAKDNRGNIYGGMGNGKICIINQERIKTVRVNNINHYYNPIIQILIKGNDIFFGSERFGIVHVNYHKGMNCQLRYFSTSHRYPATRVPFKDMCIYKNGLAATIGFAVIGDTELLNRSCSESQLRDICIPGSRSYSVIARKDGELWYSTALGLYSCDRKEIKYHPEPGRVITEKIKSMAETSDSTLILATYGQGILFFKDNRVQATFTAKEGLSDNICKKVFVHSNDIYVATQNGVTCFKYSNGHIFSIRRFNTGNGLASNDVNDVYADDTDICVATSGGLTILNARAIDSITHVPPVYITKVKNNDIALTPDSAYTLRYKQNSLHFEFIGISFRSADDVHYQYRLNTGQPWMETNNTSLDFPSLPPGNYHFQLKTKILNGSWSGPGSFNFTIVPPFWKTYWAYASYAALFIIIFSATGIFLVKRAFKRRNEQLKIRDQIINLEQQALQAMMNPHFIFNVMNSIQHYINSNDRHEANLYLSDFAKLIRMNLDISSKRYISLDDEIEYLSLYLSLERLRFGDRLTYQVNIDPAIDTDEMMMPVMLLQPFIENAIWHGILPLKGKGHVQLDITKLQDNMLKIEITDNGVGMPLAKTGATHLKTHTSKGMKMTLQRLDLLGKISGHVLYLKIHEAFPGNENKGTKVELLLPGDLA
jgi:ligand-binding sensor domain-containing protein